MRWIRISVVLILVVAMLSNTALALAFEGTTIPSSQSESQPRAEEVKWYYMEIDGVMHMRLWSLTRGIWLTEWLPMS